MSPGRRRLLLILSLPAIAALGFLGIVIADGSSVETFDYAAPLTESAVERGSYLSLAGNCATCHTVAADGFMAGGLPFETPFGRLYSTNITPDPDTGIGAWTLEEFAASMRHGVRPDGEHLYPVFPYTAFTKLSDADIAALFAYLKSIPPIRSVPPANELGFPFSWRPLMAVWKGLFLEPGALPEDATRDAEWNRGAYLVEALAHCSACHSPRNRLGAEMTNRAMAGGRYDDRVASGEYRPWSAPNLTSVEHGLGLWPAAEVAAYLKTGRNAFVETFGPMNEVIMNSTRHLSEDDVQAMAAYLKSLPAVPEQASPVEADSAVLGMGRTVYNLHCGTCHLPTGLGDEEMAPRIGGGSLVVQARDPASLINVILYGPQTAEPPLPEKWLKPMDEFRYELNDAEIAALASYLRHSWGNSGGLVTPAQVARQR